MKKKQILNGLMVVIILFTVICGVMAVGSVKGWFRNAEPAAVTDAEESTLTVAEKSGIVFVERKGISYELSENDILRDGDQITSKGSSELSVTDSNGTRISISDKTVFTVENISQCSFLLTEGEMFVECGNREMSISLESDAAIAHLKEGVAAFSTYSASSSVYVYAGDVTLEGTTLSEKVVAEDGNEISILTDANGKMTAASSVLQPETLNDNQIRHLLEYTGTQTICFAEEKLESVLTVRAEEKQAAQQAQLLLEEQAKADIEEAEKKYENSIRQNSSENVIVIPDTTSSSEIESEKDSVQDNTAGSSSKTDSGDKKYCTIEIRCDTILNNMGSLTAGKEAYVPSNGTILATSRIEFYEGETVFEVLKRACERTNIQVEYSYTPLYGSYYIEGINHLYEFDCGNESGWMYKVNGWFPNYGCSSYTLKDGDVIVWCYTCNGLGADVGGGNY